MGYKIANWKSRVLLIIFIIFTILIGIRLYLPVWVKGYVNKRIAALDDYGGSIQDIDIHLWRGAYKIYGINIYKEAGGLKEPFVSVADTDLSIEWRALFNGAIVAEIVLKRPVINFAKSQTGEEAAWDDFIDSLSPFDINRLTIVDGKLTYADYSAQPNINLFINNINASVTNLNNVTHDEASLPSAIHVRGTSIGEGKLSIDGKINILTNIPSFDIDLKLDDAKLNAFNNFAHDTAAISFESGTIGIFSELASTGGQIKGYIKPVLNDVDIVSIKDDTPVSLVWQALVSIIMEALENQSQDQFALKIPIEGKIDMPKEGFWRGFLSIFNNAFCKAFQKNIDGTVDFKDLKLES